MRTGNYHVFAKANLSSISLGLYEHTWARVLGGLPSALDVRYIYLAADTSCILQRIRGRGRAAEADVPAEYLEVLQQNHDAWLGDRSWGDRIATEVDANRTENEVWLSVCDAVRAQADRATTGFYGLVAQPDESLAECEALIKAARDASLRLKAESPTSADTRARVH